MQGERQRGDLRVDMELEVQYRTVKEFTAAYTKNISGGGLFIRSKQPLPLNSDVQVRFTLPGINRSFVVHGLVVWTNPHPSRSSYPSGMGVKFMGLDHQTEEIIAGFVREKLAAAVPEKPPPED